MSDVTGIDVSDAQGQVDWQSVAQGGVLFAFIDATDGVPGRGFQTPKRFFKQNWTAAPKAGVVRGAIHTFRPNIDALAQANHHALTLGTFSKGDIASAVRVVNDATIAAKYNDPSWYGPQLAEYLARIGDMLGRRPIVYTSADAWTALVNASDAHAIAAMADLWMAAGGTTLAGWATPTFVQDSAPGDASSVGHDHFEGTQADFATYIQWVQPAPLPAPHGPPHGGPQPEPPVHPPMPLPPPGPPPPKPKAGGATIFAWVMAFLVMGAMAKRR